MKFPTRSEAFALNEISRLYSQNDSNISIITYRRLNKLDKKILQMESLQHLEVISPSLPYRIKDIGLFIFYFITSLIMLVKLTKKFDYLFFKQIIIIIASSTLTVQLRKKKNRCITFVLGTLSKLAIIQL